MTTLEEHALLEELGYVRTWIASSVRHHQRDSILARIDRVLARTAIAAVREGELAAERGK